MHVVTKCIAGITLLYITSNKNSYVVGCVREMDGCLVFCFFCFWLFRSQNGPMAYLVHSQIFQSKPPNVKKFAWILSVFF